jgi:hypothetical protein
VVEPFGSLPEFGRGLWPAQHQHGEERELGVVQRQRFVEQMSVLDRPAAGATRQPHPAAPGKRLERDADRRLVVLDDRFAARRLVARQPQRVQRQRVLVGGRPLLLDQASEHADLGCGRVHAESLKPYPRPGWGAFPPPSEATIPVDQSRAGDAIVPISELFALALTGAMVDVLPAGAAR